MTSIKEKLSLSRSDRFIRALFNEHDGGCSHCHWRPNPTFNDNWHIILSLFFHFAIVLFLSGIQHYQDNTSPRCLSCTTRRDECARRSHNLWLSWQLLCGLCMIFYHVGEFRKHEACGNLRTSFIDIAFNVQKKSCVFSNFSDQYYIFIACNKINKIMHTTLVQNK